MLKNDNNVLFHNAVTHSIRFAILAPAFSGFWGGLISLLCIMPIDDVGWEIIFLVFFFAIVAYPFGFAVAALTGVIVGGLTSLSRQKFACLTSFVSSTLTLFQSGVFYIINPKQQERTLAWDEEQLFNFPSLLDPNDLPRLTLIMLVGSLVGGYFFGLFYAKHYNSK